MTIVLSPCGTSILGNSIELLDPGVQSATRRALREYANAQKRESVPDEARAALDALLDAAHQRMADAVEGDAARLSAEINSILRLLKARPNKDGVEHILLATDTWCGQATAEITREWLSRKTRAEVWVQQCQDLQTKNIEEFQSALVDLAGFCRNQIASRRDAGTRVVFNLTGGFKSVQGFLQALAMVYADEAIYLFEEGSDLLSIPSLPLRFDDEEMVRAFAGEMRRAALKLPVRFSEGFPGIYRLNIGGEQSLSAWGEVAWGAHKEKIYSDSLLPSPNEKIAIASKVLSAPAPSQIFYGSTGSS